MVNSSDESDRSVSGAATELNLSHSDSDDGAIELARISKKRVGKFESDDDETNCDDEIAEVVCRRRCAKRVRWSPAELRLFKHFRGMSKPPDEDSIKKLIDRHSILRNRTVPQIKSRAWHFIKTGR